MDLRGRTTISNVQGHLGEIKIKTMRVYIQSGQYHSIIEICERTWSLAGPL